MKRLLFRRKPRDIDLKDLKLYEDTQKYTKDNLSLLDDIYKTDETDEIDNGLPVNSDLVLKIDDNKFISISNSNYSNIINSICITDETEKNNYYISIIEIVSNILNTYKKNYSISSMFSTKSSININFNKIKTIDNIFENIRIKDEDLEKIKINDGYLITINDTPLFNVYLRIDKNSNIISCQFDIFSRIKINDTKTIINNRFKFLGLTFMKNNILIKFYIDTDNEQLKKIINYKIFFTLTNKDNVNIYNEFYEENYIKDINKKLFQILIYSILNDYENIRKFIKSGKYDLIYKNILKSPCILNEEKEKDINIVNYKTNYIYNLEKSLDLYYDNNYKLNYNNKRIQELNDKMYDLNIINTESISSLLLYDKIHYDIINKIEINNLTNDSKYINKCHHFIYYNNNNFYLLYLDYNDNIDCLCNQELQTLLDSKNLGNICFKVKYPYYDKTYTENSDELNYIKTLYNIRKQKISLKYKNNELLNIYKKNFSKDLIEKLSSIPITIFKDITKNLLINNIDIDEKILNKDQKNELIKKFKTLYIQQLTYFDNIFDEIINLEKNITELDNYLKTLNYTNLKYNNETKEENISIIYKHTINNENFINEIKSVYNKENDSSELSGYYKEFNDLIKKLLDNIKKSNNDIYININYKKNPIQLLNIILLNNIETENKKYLITILNIKNKITNIYILIYINYYIIYILKKYRLYNIKYRILSISFNNLIEDNIIKYSNIENDIESFNNKINKFLDYINNKQTELKNDTDYISNFQREIDEFEEEISKKIIGIPEFIDDFLLKLIQNEDASSQENINKQIKLILINIEKINNSNYQYKDIDIFNIILLYIIEINKILYLIDQQKNIKFTTLNSTEISEYYSEYYKNLQLMKIGLINSFNDIIKKIHEDIRIDIRKDDILNENAKNEIKKSQYYNDINNLYIILEKIEEKENTEKNNTNIIKKKININIINIIFKCKYNILTKIFKSNIIADIKDNSDDDIIIGGMSKNRSYQLYISENNKYFIKYNKQIIYLTKRNTYKKNNKLFIKINKKLHLNIKFK